MSIQSNLRANHDPPSTRHTLAAVRKPRRGRRRGAAALEFALVAPLFFVIVFTMFEFGRYMMVNQIITASAREGARQAVLEDADPLVVEDFVLNMLAENTLEEATVQVTPNDFDSLWLGDSINVKVRINYNSVSWISHIWFQGDPWIEANCTMNVERPE